MITNHNVIFCQHNELLLVEIAKSGVVVVSSSSLFVLCIRDLQSASDVINIYGCVSYTI